MIENAIRNILNIFDNVNREGLKETPARVADMYQEIFKGTYYSNDDIIEEFNKTFQEVETGDLVVLSDIQFYSMCEHHVLPFFGKIAVGYIPDGKVIGLSKIIRIIELVSKRLQLQERIGEEVSYILRKILGTNDVIIVIEAEHLCMAMRGVNKPGAKTKTASLCGTFVENIALRQEFYSLIK